MSSQVQPIGTFPSVFRIISPSITSDASGGAVQTNANAKFNTNVPLDRYMLITEVDWNVVHAKSANIVNQTTNNQRFSWQIIGQLTEALARTAVAGSDPVYVDDYLDESVVGFNQLTAAAISAVALPKNEKQPYWKHVLANPWATAAQQLNLILSNIPNTDNNQNGPSINMFVVIEYQLLPLTPDVRSYLATRVQIAGQA